MRSSPAAHDTRATRRRLLLAGALVTVGIGELAAGSAARAALPELVAASKQSVFPIGGFDPLASPRFNFRGTAFVVGNGLLAITNAHVVADDKIGQWALQIPAARADDAPSWRTVEIVARDAAHDLALLRISGSPLPALRLGSREHVREGEAVALMGFPIGGVLGYRPVTHAGIVSSIAAVVLPAISGTRLDAGTISRARAGSFEIYQLDTTAYPGNSGGPVLLERSGEVVAVVNMVLSRNRESALQHPSGISYAIPVRWVHELLASRSR